MKKRFVFLLPVLFTGFFVVKLTAQNVGIGTTTPHPTARLQVELGTSLTDGLLVTGTAGTSSSVPDLNAGTRMMFYPGRGAFRAGTVVGPEWNNSKMGDHSAAFGYSTTAGGNFSFAAGYLTEASGAKALSMGESTLAAGANSIALGYRTQAIGLNSVALGYGTRAQAAYATVIGRYNDYTVSGTTDWVTTDPLLVVGNGGSDATRHNAMVVYKNGNLVLKNPAAVTGEPALFTVPVSGSGTRLMWLPEKSAFRVGTIASNGWDAAKIGLYSFASGMNTSALGASSTAMGNNTGATGASSTAMGGSTNAYGDYSTAIGYHTVANPYASLVIGRYNEQPGTFSKTSWEPNDPLLVLGNGTPTVPGNALVVYKNGNTEIRGSVGIAGLTFIGNNALINGYTQMGSNSDAAPLVKMKKITGTGPAVNGTIAVAHGLPDAAAILSVQIFMQYGSAPLAVNTVPPNYTISNGYEYQYAIVGSYISISNKTGNSANISGKQFKMLITYEQGDLIITGR